MPELEPPVGNTQPPLPGVLPRGTLLRGYEVKSVLGKGAFGITYRALDATLDRDVAIKEYLPTTLALREGRTLHHDVFGRHGAGKVILRAAPPGTGIIAGGPMRAVFETLGMQDVVAKSLGSSNPYNMVRATFDALKRQDSPRSVAARRNIKVSSLQARRRETGEAEQSAD